MLNSEPGLSTKTPVNQPYARKRRWPRYKISVPIRVIVNLVDKTRIIEGRGNELSEGGMAVTAGVELDINNSLMIEFTPPYTSLPIRVKGEVRNRHGYRYGVEFCRQGEEQTTQVERLRHILSALGQPE